MKLTKEDVMNALVDASQKCVGQTLGIDNFWQAIEADREAIREETRAELLSAENVMSIEEIERQIYQKAIASGVDQFAMPGSKDFGIWIKTKLYPAIQPLTVCRPPKKRPMTNEEKCRAFVNKTMSPGSLAEAYAILAEELAAGTPIDTILAREGIPTETEAP